MTTGEILHCAELPRYSGPDLHSSRLEDANA